MTYKTEVRDKAYMLYAQGVSVRKVSQQIKVDRRTITEWINKYGWKERKLKVEEKTVQKLDQNLTKDRVANRENQIKIFQASLYDYAQQLKDGKIQHSDVSAVAIGKQLLLLYGEAETRSDDVGMQKVVELMDKMFGRHEWRDRENL
jgi:transposase